MNMALGGNKRKVSKRLADILEYKEEFKVALAEEAITLPDRKPFSDKKSRNDPRNDVIVCARFSPGLEKEEEDGMLENIIARNPFTFVGELSFTFKNETRVQFKKYAYEQSNSEKSQVFIKFSISEIIMVWHILYPFLTSYLYSAQISCNGHFFFLTKGNHYNTETKRKGVI